MDYRQKRILKFVVIIAVLAISFGIYQYYGINFGLDLQGGSQIVLEADPDDADMVTGGRMSTARTVIEGRVDGLGVEEANVQRQGTDRLLVELPGIEDPYEAAEVIGETGLLTIENRDGEVLLSGEHVIDANPRFSEQQGGWVVDFQLDDEGGEQFAEITRYYMENNLQLGFFLDGEELHMGGVADVIRTEGMITGFGRDSSRASEVAVQISEGALPIPFREAEIRHVGPSLGDVSLERSIMAGLIGLLIISIYMIIYYKFPGFIVALVLVIYGMIFMGTLSGLGATLTLPGIAGLVLSIGMAVDANIIIYERIKDERKKGKKVATAIQSGFSRAYRTILDANITTLIAAIILAYFTTGSVRGFAVVLIIGLVVSMFTAFVVTRFLLDIFINTRMLKDETAFGAHRR